MLLQGWSAAENFIVDSTVVWLHVQGNGLHVLCPALTKTLSTSHPDGPLSCDMDTKNFWMSEYSRKYNFRPSVLASPPHDLINI